ncbi:MAG: TonB-dependent receptor, partial [Candidatus Omnitrophica bacterium]|nr:TonB-dependent receptor [Candidatus Omnitrophota bacterium]
LRYFFSDDFSLRFSFDRIWRAPSFTELYYVSSTDVGNSSLGAQQSNNFELGTDLFLNQDLRLSLNSFLRNQHDTIDWVKNTSSAAWQANNVGTVNAYGLDCSLEAELNILLLEKINFSYTYLALDKESAYNFSKYVFDYDRHKLVSRFKFDLKGVDLNTVVNFSHPLTRKNYTTVDLKAEKKFGQLSLILEGNNIFNRSYQEMADISTSGRWYKCGLSYSF